MMCSHTSLPTNPVAPHTTTWYGRAVPGPTEPAMPAAAIRARTLGGARPTSQN